LFAGDCDDAWSDAAAISAEVHVRRLDRPVARALACVPHRYEDLWTGAKGVYKVEPVVADGGELVLYAPHITACATEHGGAIEEIGYHCRDYFLAQPERFAHVARGVIAHSTHVRGPGTYDAARGIERGRIAVTLATGIGPQQCAAMNVGYLDPAGIDRGAFAATGALVIEHAGETLYRLAAS
jgi:nickel-dependent lactate racemase